jgi:Zn-dependent peptidase ImmA (M78 family)
MMRPRYTLARRRALELLQAGRVKKPPVPLEKLVAAAGAILRYEPFAGELSGTVYRRPEGGAVIGVNSLHSPARKRFTIAHELGHLLLHRDEKLHVDEQSPIGLRTDLSRPATDANEIEANQFAAELLMPQSFLVKDLEDLSNLEADVAIDRLAKRYQVSTEAMTIRLSKLGALS